MNYIEWNIDPVAFWVGGIPVMYYSLLLIAGTVASVWILKRVYWENGIPWEHLQILVMLSIAGLFLGGAFGPLPDLRVCVLFRTSIGNFAPGTG